MYKNTAASSHRAVLRYLVFLCWPIFALVDAIACFGQKGTITIITLFGFIIGLSYDYSDLLSDGNRYAMWFTGYFDLGFDDFVEILKRYGDPGYNDIYTIISYFGLSRITHNPSILFGVWGMVYFYFLSTAVFNVISYARENSMKISPAAKIFLISLILFLPLNSINGVRMWTAFMIFFSFSFKAILYNRPKYLILSATSILVHFSFIFPLILLAVFWQYRTKPFIIYVILIVSFVASDFVPKLIESYGDVFSPGVENKLEAYSNEDYRLKVDKELSEQVWYAKYRQDILMYYLFGALFLAYRLVSKKKCSKEIRSMFFFSLTMLSLYNLTGSISSRSRFFMQFGFSTLAFLTLLTAANKKSKGLKRYAYLGIIPLGIWIAVGQVNALRAFDLSTIFGNFLTISLKFIH